jgi:hypothetical protein
MKTVEIIVKFFLTIVLITGGYLTSYSQIEKVRLETYYISNEDDATDTIGGSLESGNTTYRLFIDLQPGSKLLAIYGDEDHPLRFSSTTPFFNHREEGITFGKDVNRNRYEIGTVALDTYITLGQCSKPFSQGAYFGIPKEGDQDGSVIGGVNNDGGSQEIAAGLLTNANPQMGIPITMADGLTFKKELPDSWIEIGFKDLLTDLDTTIFSLNKTSFSSSNALLRNSGVTGVDPDQNEVLIAQLTTKGDISFEINLEIEILKNGNYQTVKYVAQNSSLKEDEIFEPLLNYPYTCGCTDPHYLEASTYLPARIVTYVKPRLFSDAWIPSPAIMTQMRILIFRIYAAMLAIAMTLTLASYVQTYGRERT